MPKTPLNQPSVIGSQTFYSYSCRFEDVCRRYNSALTVKVKVGVQGYPESIREIERLNYCTHGGGPGCGSYRHRVNESIGWYDPLPNRSFTAKEWEKRIAEQQQTPAPVQPSKTKVTVTTAAPDVPLLDAQEQRLKALKAQAECILL